MIAVIQIVNNKVVRCDTTKNENTGMYFIEILAKQFAKQYNKEPEDIGVMSDFDYYSEYDSDNVVLYSLVEVL